MANKKTLKAAPPPTIKKAGLLNPTVVSDYADLRAKAAILESQIDTRLEYILKTVYQTFGATLNCWYFDGAEEGEVGDLFDNMNQNEISGLCLEPFILNDDCVVILKDGQHWGFDGGIPTRWLSEDFEEELAQGKLLYRKHLLEKAEQKKAKKLAAQQEKLAADREKEEQRQKVLAKLSPEERSILDLK